MGRLVALHICVVVVFVVGVLLLVVLCFVGSFGLFSRLCCLSFSSSRSAVFVSFTSLSYVRCVFILCFVCLFFVVSVIIFSLEEARPSTGNSQRRGGNEAVGIGGNWAAQTLLGKEHNRQQMIGEEVAATKQRASEVAATTQRASAATGLHPATRRAPRR